MTKEELTLDYVKAIIIKYVMTAVVLGLVLTVFYDVGFPGVLLLSVVLTIAGFFLGDLFLLPRFENWGASIGDFLLTFAGVWIFATYFTAAPVPPITAAALAAVIVTICEVLFHNYVDSHILHSDNRTGGRTKADLKPEERMQTEFGEEIDTSEKEK